MLKRLPHQRPKNRKSLKNDRLINILSQIAPNVLLLFYIIAYFFLTDTDFYYNNYDKYIIQADTILLVLSVIGAIFYICRWKIYSILNFKTVIILNLLTEANVRMKIDNYYGIYFIVILVLLAETVVCWYIKRALNAYRRTMV